MPTLNKIKLNGITYDIGNSTSNLLIVTQDPSTHKVNYSPSEIRSALSNGKLVFFYQQNKLIPIVEATNNEALAPYVYCFSSDDPDDDYAYITDYCIDDEKDVEISQVVLASRNYVNTKFSATIKREVVQTLPTQDIQIDTIYMVPKTTAVSNNVYDEYMYINNAWELIGTTEVDLSNYLAKDNSTSYTPSGNYNPATKKYVDDKIGGSITYGTANPSGGSNGDIYFKYSA